MNKSIDYNEKLHFHFHPKQGWINDPNGLVFFKNYYHVFYQHEPDSERPWFEPRHWGHARTKDFLEWEELPVALYPDTAYDNEGCWSGTAIVKDDVLYLFYASLYGEEKKQTISIAYSSDGIHFEKYAGNPVINDFPPQGSKDFRDPAVWQQNGKFYCVIASAHVQSGTGRLLLYVSENLFDWKYHSIFYEWESCVCTECPSVIPIGNQLMVSVSVCPKEGKPYFRLLYGSFENECFLAEHTACLDNGPDQYAGQMFRDPKGRVILISWFPGWEYWNYAPKDIGCMSAAREVKFENGVFTLYPVKEYQHLLKEEDPCVKRTESGFVIERTGREALVYEGVIDDLKILRDAYMAEIFVNGGRDVYTVLL